MSTVTFRPSRRLSGAIAVAATLLVPALARTSLSTAQPGVVGCGLPTAAVVRCPSVIERSPDMPSFNKSIVADPVRHRVYVVGPDQGGWESFLAVDTRTRHPLVQRSFRATPFTHYYDYAVNSEAALLTPDGRTVISAGHVYQPDSWQAGLVAIDTATGTLRWSWVNPHKGSDDLFEAVTVDPTGRQVFAVGREEQGPLGSYRDRAVVRSFDVDSGRQLWHSEAAGSDVDRWFSAVQYAGHRVVATGSVLPADGQDVDQLAASIDPRSGKVLRVRRFDDGGDEYGEASALLPSGEVVVTGTHTPTNMAFDNSSQGLFDVDTRALDPRTLAPRWHEQTTDATGDGVAIEAAGDRAIIGFTSELDADYSPLAHFGGRPGLLVLDGRTGQELHRWTDVLPAADTTFDFAALLADGKTAYVVGTASPAKAEFAASPPLIPYTDVMTTSDGVVTAIDLATGATRWTSDYNDDMAGADRAVFDGAALTPDSLFVSGRVDTHSQLPWGGTLNGMLLRYEP